MPRHLPPFSGTGVALITPMQAGGGIDWPALDRCIEHQIQNGVDYIVSLGTTGEAITLSKRETRQLLDRTLERVDGRLPVVAGHFGHNDTAELSERFKSFNYDGLAAVMSSSPAYLRPNQEGIYQHYMRVADACPLPLIIYNVPARTGRNVEPETILRLAESGAPFAAIKEAAGALGAFNELVRHAPEDFAVLSGDDLIAWPAISIGAHGSISVIANAFPHRWSEMIRAGLSGDMRKARRHHLDLWPFHKWLYYDGNPAGIKYLMSQQGLCENVLRLPQVGVSPRVAEALRSALGEIGHV